MHKDKEQQKKAQVKQLELFSSMTSEPVRAVIGGTDRTLLSGVELSSRLESRRTLTENILEKVVDYENLKMVCPTRATIFMAKNDEGVKVNETALVRTRMPGGVGGQR
jgi:hypothetical protein